MKCFAFISYSRADLEIANWLHKKLEKYPYPLNLVKVENRPSHDKYVRKVFMDIKDLSVTEHEFTEDIKQCLEESRYLIVLCSQNSVSSDFVNKEIDYFLKTHGNNDELILPVFIDKVEENVPSSLSQKSVLKRNCPIYNSKLSEKSEANQYCFYHVASFLLKVDFTDLYDRYESYSKRKRKYKTRLALSFIVLLVLSSLFLFMSLNRQQRLTIKQKELTDFEKTIFPLSVVFGYEKNFLSPAIEYMKKNRPQSEIYILMPYSVEDLEYQDRIFSVGERVKKELGADSIYSERLPTRMRRGTSIGRIASRYDDFENVYVDFASTTSTFMQILEYKQQQYHDLNGDEVIRDYADTFIRQTKDLLGEDSVYVHFYVSQTDFVQALRDAVQSK